MKVKSLNEVRVTNATLCVTALAAATMIHGYQMGSWAWGFAGVIVLLFTPVGLKQPKGE